MRLARAASPSITGMIGCSPGIRSKPSAVMPARKMTRVLEEPRAQLGRSLEKVEDLSEAAPATTGASVLEKR